MVLITGATGIVGSHILDLLLRRGQRVSILLREESNRNVIDRIVKRHLNAEALVSYKEGDILDPVSIRMALEGCEQVYHCAAMVSFDQKKAEEMQQTNAHGTANVVDACLEAGISALCYISSTAAIGDVNINGILSEESVWTTDKGRSAYSLSKRSAEFEALRGREEGLNVSVLNPAVIIGSGDWGKSSTTLITSCASGMRLYPPGGNGFVSAKDVARFAVESLSQKWFTGRYLLVGENLTFKELFTRITAELGSTQPKMMVPIWLLSFVQGLLRLVESTGLNIFSLSSENIASAKRVMRYSNKRVLDCGFRFTSIDQSVRETVLEFKKVTSPSVSLSLSHP